MIGDVPLGVLTGTVSFTHHLPIMLTRAPSPTLTWPLPELEGSQAGAAASVPHGVLLQGTLAVASAETQGATAERAAEERRTNVVSCFD